MKLHVVSPDANGTIDGTIQRQILRHLPLTDSELDSDAVIVPISYHPNYRFNEGLRDIHQVPIVILDFLEFGWNWGDKPNVLGRGNLAACEHFAGREWAELDAEITNWRVEIEKLLFFKRELREVDRNETMLPIEWLCDHEIPPIESKQAFDMRPVEVFHCWGYSSPARVYLHADIFRAMADRGIEVLSEIDQLDKITTPTGKLWASVYAPWFARKPLADVLRFQQQAKITTSLPGAGVKCFRHSEAPIGSVMALPKNSLAWSYPWTDENSIQLRPTEFASEFDCLFEYLRHQSDLYPIYVEGQRNLENYRCETYCKNYILPAIEKIL